MRCSRADGSGIRAKTTGRQTPYKHGTLRATEGSRRANFFSVYNLLNFYVFLFIIFEEKNNLLKKWFILLLHN